MTWISKRTLFLGIAGFLVLSFNLVRAQEADVSFPVAELGGCESKESCKAYCNEPQNVEACIAFAETHGLVKTEEAQAARRVLAETGPGGCQTPDECKAYCENSDNGEECVEFAAEHGLIPPDKIEVVRKIVRQGGPGGCKTEAECRTYCDNPAHGEECLTFAEANGLIDEKDRKAARTVLTKGGPGGCFNEESCKAYCNDPSHTEECVAFAVENDLMDEQEAERILATGGAGPGGCRGEEECEAYCENPDNTAACVEFGIEHGFIAPEEAALALKVARDGGPGGCRGERECRAYCEGPEHGEECFNFGVENGLIPPEEVERARSMIGREGPGGCRGRQCQEFCENSENADACLEFAVQNDLIPPEEAEQARRGLEIMKQGGPGGCRGPRECETFCSDPNNEDECFAFAEEHGFIEEEHHEQFKKFKEKEGELIRIVEEEGGPGGCRSKRECMEYCMSPANESECNLFSAGHGFEPPSRPEIRLEELERFSAPPVLEDFEGPGGCKGPKECFEFCSQNKEECRGFRPPGLERPRPEERGFERLESAAGSGPGGCQGQSECFRFCSNPENKLECVRFKREQGTEVPQEFLENPELLREFRTEERGFPLDKPPGFRDAPGGCGSPVECFEYCGDPAHAEDCGSFRPPPPFQPGFEEGESERPRIGAPSEEGEFRFEERFEGEGAEGESEFRRRFEEEHPEFRGEFELREEFQGEDLRRRFEERVEPGLRERFELREEFRGEEFRGEPGQEQFFPPQEGQGRAESFGVPPSAREGEFIEIRPVPEPRISPEERGFFEERRTEESGRFSPPPQTFSPREQFSPPQEQFRSPESFSPSPENFTPPPGFQGQGVLNYKGPRFCRSVSDCLTVCAISGSITDCRVMFKNYAFTRL